MKVTRKYLSGREYVHTVRRMEMPVGKTIDGIGTDGMKLGKALVSEDSEGGFALT